MASHAALNQCRAAIEDLLRSLDSSDGSDFDRLLQELTAARHATTHRSLRSLADELAVAIRECSSDATVTSLSNHDVPDAKARLSHILELTNEAAHRTLEHIEHCAPLAAQVADSAAQIEASSSEPSLQTLAAAVRRDAQAIGNHLTEVLLAQSYQDLTGQIIKRLIELVGDIEKVLEILRRLGDARSVEDLPHQLLLELRERRSCRNENGYGPAVPPTVASVGGSPTDDVDTLLSQLGI